MFFVVKFLTMFDMKVSFGGMCKKQNKGAYTLLISILKSISTLPFPRRHPGISGSHTPRYRLEINRRPHRRWHQETTSETNLGHYN